MEKTILFVCTENSARSQMAEAFFNAFNTSSSYSAASAGLSPAKRIKPLAIKVMKEMNMDISRSKPKLLTPEMARSAHRIILMGCLKNCPLTPARKTVDWGLRSPEHSIKRFRTVRDEIEKKVAELCSSL
jgi:arsenate reductase